VSPAVAVIMGSSSDWETMQHAPETLRTLEIPYEVRVLSAHRTPDALEQYVSDVEARGCQVIVAAAGGAAHLTGVVA
jgi:5-(carboxyamino)imidazole ribonucleotide mutase